MADNVAAEEIVSREAPCARGEGLSTNVTINGVSRRRTEAPGPTTELSEEARLVAAILLRGADEVRIAAWTGGRVQLAVDVLDRVYPLDAMQRLLADVQALRELDQEHQASREAELSLVRAALG